MHAPPPSRPSGRASLTQNPSATSEAAASEASPRPSPRLFLGEGQAPPGARERAPRGTRTLAPHPPNVSASSIFQIDGVPSSMLFPAGSRK